MNSMMNFEEIKKKLIREYQTSKGGKKSDDKTFNMAEPSKQALSKMLHTKTRKTKKAHTKLTKHNPVYNQKTSQIYMSTDDKSSMTFGQKRNSYQATSKEIMK